MNELMLMIAKKAPEEVLLKVLEQELEDYKAASEEDRKEHKFRAMTILLGTRYLTDDNSMEEALKEADRINEMHRLFDNIKQ